MKLVFVSHATVDHELVEQFVDIILKSCGLTETEIFASSIPGMDITAGRDLLAAVRAEVSATTLVIAVITPTYPTRPVCLAELGAAWGVAGKLLPVLAPGINRDQLDGVLTGMKVDYLDQEKALDEIAGRIEEETGRRPESHASWTRAKQKWLRIVGDLVASLSKPEVISKGKHDELKAKLAETENALADAESEVTQLKETVQRLKAAKDAAEVAEILLPRDDIERFSILRESAVAELRKVAPVVQEAIRCQLAGDEMPWPNPMEDPGFASAADEAVSEGLLIDNGNGLVPNNDHGPVRRASQAVDALADALSGDSFEPEFFEWFDNEYDGPPKLEQGAIWRSVLHELRSRY
jgi:hypothetical protein